ncbi:MAG: ShlB/FhaC/HecB family hemolysin secretion/activation protein [Aquabacterium sp.]
MSRAAVSLISLTSLALAAALTPVGQAVAQSVPNAGDVLRDLPGTQPKMPALSEPAPQADTSVAGHAPAESFVLSAFNVPGATVLTPSQIAALAEPYVGKSIDEQQVGAIVAALRKRYDDKGYTLASIGYPSVKDGVLTVNVIEPRLGRVQVPMGADAPLSADRVNGLMSFFCLHSGGLLSTQSLERVMFALNDTPGVAAKASLSPAGDEGVYNVNIQVQPRRWWDASVQLDNQGMADAGRWRTTGLARLNNPLGIGDNIDFQGLISDAGGVKVGRVSYELPVWYTPARLSVAYAKLGYGLGGDLSAYGANGTARVFETNLTYPLLRSRTRTLMARLGAESKNLTDKVDAFEDVPDAASRGDKRILAILAGLNYESRDTWLGGGFNSASAQLHWGHLRFKDAEGQNWDDRQGDASTAGRFGKAELQYGRLQSISRAVSVYVNISQQVASRSLDAAEKMTLGGPKGVRAYSPTEGASDEASLLTSELRYWIDSNWTVFALYDWARGRRNRDLDAPDSSNDILLHGAGLGVVATYPDWATVKATVAWRGPRRGETDTSNDKPRLYLQAQHSF